MNDWQLTNYPDRDRIRVLAADLFHSVVEVRGMFELHYIPEGHEQSDQAGEWGDGDLVIEDSPVGTYPVALDHNNHHKGTPAQWEALREEYKWIRDYFDDRCDPKPETVSALLPALTNAADKIYRQYNNAGDEDHHPGEGVIPGSGSPAMTKIHNKLNHWTGAAADNFEMGYWYPIQRITFNQSHTLTATAYALIGYRDLLVKNLTTMESILIQANEAVQAIVASESSGWGVKRGALAAFATITAGAAGLAIPATGGAALPAVTSAVATIIAGVSSALDGDDDSDSDNETELGAESVDRVLDNMIWAVQELSDDVTRKEEQLKETFEQYTNVVKGEQGGTMNGNLYDSESDKRHTCPKPAITEYHDDIADGLQEEPLVP